MISIVSFTSKYSSDVKALLLSVLDDEFGHTGVERPDLDDILKAYQKDEFSNFFLALDASKLVGTIAILHNGDGSGVMKRFCVPKEKRGKGIGQKLLLHLLNFAKEKRYTSIYLQTTTDMKIANALYEKNGFTKIKQPAQLANAHLLPTSVFYKIKLVPYTEEKPFNEFDDKYTAKRSVL